jgi:hypothetical protein
MCSIDGGQLGRICRAIDELAAGSADQAEGAGNAEAARGAEAAHQAEPTRGADAGHQAGAAAQTEAADQAEAGSQAERDGGGDIARLAAIWEMVAAADPELAKRLPGYLSAAE